MAFPFLGPSDYVKLNQNLKLIDGSTTLYESEERHGGYVWVRRPYVQLSSTMKTTQSTSSKIPDLEIYADTVDCTGSLDFGGFDNITIFARVVTCGDSAQNPMKFLCGDGAALLFYSATTDRDLFFEFSTKSGTIPCKTRTPAGQAGFILSIDERAQSIDVSGLPSPDEHFTVPSMIDQLKDDGTMTNFGSTAPNS